MVSTIEQIYGRAASEETKVYLLFWRTKASHPWHSQEFESRSEAHARYFKLVGRGIEAHLEVRPACTA